ncbi:MAG TPA: hypothetical protein VK929_06170, partial [Longimicrobiales bacterium]|nr:hypothetical protein [Longimicrobiales bacterium]
RPAGPDEHELEHGTSHIYGRVEHEDGRTATGALRGPNGYLLTAHAALLAVRRVLDGDATTGFRTPSTAFGAEFVRAVPGVVMSDLD